MSFRNDVKDADLAHVDLKQVERAIYRRRPRFQSVQEFAQFARYAADKWQAPGVSSPTASFIELEQLGTKVDTSMPPVAAYEPIVVDHLATVRAVLRDAGDHVDSQKLLRWGEHDVQGIPQKQLADAEGVSRSTMSDWVIEVRDVLSVVLARQGMMDEAYLETEGAR